MKDQTKQRIFSTLCFVLPDEGTLRDESMPLEALEVEAAWQLAYHQQLERQNCPEFGDGLCPPQESRIRESTLPVVGPA
jgi:hypothetical protein